MVDTIGLACTGATRQTLAWRAVRPVVVEAVELQDADSPCLASIVVCPKGSASLGACLAQGTTVLPSGQIQWSGRLTLGPDEEVRGYVDGGTAADRLFLTVKVRG